MLQVSPAANEAGVPHISEAHRLAEPQPPGTLSSSTSTSSMAGTTTCRQLANSSSSSTTPTAGSSSRDATQLAA